MSTKRHQAQLIISTMLLILSTSISLGGDESSAYIRGQQAVSSGDYEQAYRVFLKAAMAGDAWSQFGTGALYLNGQGTKQDTDQSTYWFRKAAYQGHIFAQFNLGNAYLHGRGVKQDQAQAAYWWQRAAMQGNAIAQKNLGVMLYFDIATQDSKRLGKVWLATAADQGHEAAKQILSEIASTSESEGDSFWQLEPERSEVKILTLDENHYGINILSIKSRESIRHLLTKFNLTDNTYIYRIPRGGDFIHGVILGAYPDKQSANKALGEISPELIKNKPWPIQIGTVQARIQSIHTRQLTNTNEHLQ
ncbi:hypothetical protein MNBD_GAMMA26-37 [hydrothermal vent metagenome]|uniref:SPOR domain-containing protein n=1 Tax=hydrothermal vent metagenome TaxID=652676 RepID=A0A3B1B000_9ZZZZ